MPQSFRAAVLVLATTGIAAPALADYQPIRDRAEFLGVVTQGELTRMGIRLTVTRDGAISGSAFGREVTGNWTWEDGFFCRDLAWGDTEIGYNCQEVARDGRSLRFTSDKGTGESASLRLE
ncbi:dihydrodipicolinate reductase [Meridianimarinicoccus sp. RP-17]|uniref:dihydrodipicolinate reductase n=1 Tax=Meridianimarinicoccus zhengii TaxID=2056810 RepID=UPI000DADDF28|nr:dihydrodipicolinate reductase [Phycocomes zhengii]